MKHLDVDGQCLRPRNLWFCMGLEEHKTTLSWTKATRFSL